MDETAPPPRRYHSQLRQNQAERTRQLIAAAASERFLAAGWAGTSVRSVAAAAGVAEATVYSVYGSKAGLATSLIDSIDAGAGLGALLDELDAASGDPLKQLTAQVAFDRRLFERSGPMLRVMLEAQRHEPDLATAYAEGRNRGNRGRRGLFESWPKSAWRRGMTITRALDVYAIVVSFPCYEVATVERGWTPDRIERWWLETLCEQLLG